LGISFFQTSEHLHQALECGVIVVNPIAQGNDLLRKAANETRRGTVPGNAAPGRTAAAVTAILRE
jgi:hypothetical protein